MELAFLVFPQSVKVRQRLALDEAPLLLNCRGRLFEQNLTEKDEKNGRQKKIFQNDRTAAETNFLMKTYCRSKKTTSLEKLINPSILSVNNKLRHL